MTTRDPGARLVFTQGLVRSPFAIAFFASSPAPTITEGFEVLVQLVIAAITTEPSRRWNVSPSCSHSTCGGRSSSTVSGCPIMTLPPPSPIQRE